MKDQDKTKEQLIEELSELRRKVAGPGKSGDGDVGADSGRADRVDTIAEELRWKTALLEAQMNSSLDGIVVVDGNGHKILQNQRTIDLWKIPKEVAEDPDDQVQAWYAAEATVNPREFLDQVSYLYTHPYETSRDEIALKDGTILDRYSSPVIGKDGTYYGRVWAFRDITERKRAEEALRQKSSLLEALVLSSHDGILVACNGKKLLQNQRAIDLWKIPKEVAEQDDLERQVNAAGRMSKDPGVFQEKASLALDSRSKDSWHGIVELVDGTVLDRHSYPVEGANGEYYGRVWIFRDITERTRAEDELRTSRLQLKEAAEMAKIAYWEHDEATDEFVFNDEFYELYGTSVEIEGGYRMTPGEYMKRFVHPDDRKELGQRVTDSKARERKTYVHRIVRRDGEVIYILARNRVYTDEQGRRLKVIGVNQDITDRINTEQALRMSETRLRAILDNSRDAISVTKDGVNNFVNPAYVALFGYDSADELLGQPAYDVIAPDSRLIADERAKKRARGEYVPSYFEWNALRKDGTTFVVESTLSTFRLNEEEYALTIMRDITERRQAEEEIRLLKHSIDVHNDGAFWLGPDNRFVYVNDAACKSLGYDRETLVSMSLLDIDRHQTEEGMKEAWRRIRTDGSFQGETIHRRKDGTEFPVQLVVTHVQFGGRELACGFAHDISEKKRLEEQLRQAQKLEAVGTLAGGVAHDFNNILTVIMGLANLMQMKLGADDINRPSVDQIVASSQRAAELTQSLLAFSRKQRISLEPHTLNGVVTSTANLLKRLVPEDIRLEVDLCSEDTSVLLDVTQMSQVLMNLATNARDAMPHGGTFTVKTERAKIDVDFVKAHGFGRVGDYVRLSVSDTGTGMDKETLKRIFEPFFTTKEVGKGTGLGLASAYGIVKQHNGYITVASTLFKGTTFDVYLPLTSEQVPENLAAAPPFRGGSETILVVEDDANVRKMITEILASQGYCALDAGNGDDAIRVFDAHREAIKLVILDVVMPGKNGRQIFDEIARIQPGAKAIFMSGYTGDVVIDKGIREENVEFLQKPLSLPTLLNKVREVLDR